MIEKKLNDKIEDTVVSALEQEATFESVDPVENEQPQVIATDPQVSESVMQPEADPPSADVDGMQVAGLGTKILKGLAERTAEAEKKVVSPIPDEPVQDIGGQLVIREDQTNVDEINRALGGDYVKGLNLPNIEGMGLDEIDGASYLQNLKNLNAELFESARRGTLNIDAIVNLAESKDLDLVVHQWSKRNPGEAASSEDLVAGIIGLDAIMRDTAKAWDAAAQLPAGPERDAATTRAMQLMNLEAQIAANISGATSEAGRALYTARTLQQSGLPNASERMTQLYGLENAQDVEHLGRLYMALPSPNQKAQFVQKGLVARGTDAVIEIWINSILTSPVTHMVNIAGNASFMGLRVLETMGAAGVGRIRSAVTGNAERVRMREALAQLSGIQQGWLDALLVAGRTGFTEEPTDFVSKIDVRNRRAIGTTGDPRVVLQEIRDGNYVAAAVNTFGITQRMGGRALLAEDEFFKGIGYRMTLHQRAEIDAATAYDEALNGGKTVEEAREIYANRKADILMNPPMDIAVDAKEAARVMTFQGDLDGTLGKLQGAMTHPIVKMFVPFFKTPSNVMREAFIRTPLGVLAPSVRKSLKAGGREADMAISRIATGSAIMGSFGALAMGLYGEDNETVVLGAGPTDPQARAAMQRMGLQPYSINIKQEDGTYKSITYSRFDPVSGVLAMAADYAYYAQHEENSDWLDGVATAAVLSISEYALQMPFLQGVQELGAALMNPDPTVRSEQLTKLFAEKFASAGLSVVPTVSSFTAGIERLQDPAARSTDLPPGKVPFTNMDITDAPTWAKGFYSALQKAKARNPFFNEDLPKDLNEWGEVRMQGTGAGWEFWSPVRITNSKYSAVDQEMMSLGDGISRTPKKINGVELNRDQRLRWITLTNQMDAMGRMPDNEGYDPTTTLLPILNEMIFTNEYQMLPDKAEKMNAIRDEVSDARTRAKNRLRQEFLDLDEKIKAAD